MCTGLIGHYIILMIGVTGRLALRVYGADWALYYTYDWCHGLPGTVCMGLMCHFSAIQLSRCCLSAGANVCVCVVYISLSSFSALCIVKMSSFGSIVRMCRLSAGANVCVVYVVCTSLCLYFLPTILSRYLVFCKYNCQDVSSFSSG